MPTQTEAPPGLGMVELGALDRARLQRQAATQQPTPSQDSANAPR